MRNQGTSIQTRTFRENSETQASQRLDRRQKLQLLCVTCYSKLDYIFSLALRWMVPTPPAHHGRDISVAQFYYLEMWLYLRGFADVTKSRIWGWYHPRLPRPALNPNTGVFIRDRSREKTLWTRRQGGEMQTQAEEHAEPPEAVRGEDGICSRAFRGSSLLMPRFGTSGLQRCERQHFSRFKPPIW